MSNFTLGQTWEGGLSSSWNVAGNWNPTVVPDYSDDIVINTSITYDLEISGTEQCNSIEFINNGIIYFATSGTNRLEIHGDLINNSSSADIVGNSNGTVVMAGTTDNIIDGATKISLFNLEMNKYYTNRVDVQKKLLIKHKVTPVSGKLYAWGLMYLVADLINGTTAYAESWTSLSKIYEEVVIEQRVPYTGFYYHYLSSPVSEDDYYQYYTIGGQLEDNASSANVYDWSFALINSGFPDWFIYNESICSGLIASDVITEYITELSITLTSPEAEAVLTSFGWESSDDLLTDQRPLGTGVLSRVEFDTQPDIINWKGYLNDGELLVDITNTTCTTPAENADGLNLVGNPYPSPINWTTLYNSDDNEYEVTPFAYIWSPDAGATTAFGAGAGDGYFSVLDADNGTSNIPSPDWAEYSGTLNNYIGIGQGFFVEALDDGVLTFNNNCRYMSNTPAVLRESKPREAMQLLLKSESGNDYTNIYLNNAAVDEFDKKEDANKLMNSKVNIATICDNKKLMINRLSKQRDEIEVPLLVSPKVGERAILSIGNTAFESVEYVAIFMDKKQNTQEIMTKNFNYSFKVEKGEEENRFVIKFVKGQYSINNVNNSFGSVYVANEQLNIIANNFDLAVVTLTDASGRFVQQENVQFSNGKGIFNLSELSKGIYIVHVQSSENSFNQKVFINK